MNEETLIFRAWSGDQMIHFGEGFVSYMMTDEDTLKAWMFFPIVSEKFSMSGMDVMQYTGLQDKNGTKIYDGDVLKHGHAETLYFVKWGRGLWVALPYEANWQAIDCEKLCDIYSQVEVVGHVHQDPELYKAIQVG